MRQLKLNKVVAFLGVFLLLLLTYFRQNFFLEINAILASEAFDRSNSYWLSDFFNNIPFANLLKLKWGLTMVFSIVMTAVTILSLHFWFKSIHFFKVVGLFYLVLFVVICLLALIGFLTNSFNDIYFALRKLLGLVQSPLPFFTFFTLFYRVLKKDDSFQPYKF